MWITGHYQLSFPSWTGTVSGIELKDIRQILQVLYDTRNAQSALSSSQILSSVMERFFNLSLLSYHCLRNPALVVPRSRARTRYRSFGNWFFRAIREAFGAARWMRIHIEVYIQAWISDSIASDIDAARHVRNIKYSWKLLVLYRLITSSIYKYTF